MNDQPSRHILKLSCGVTVELVLDEATGFFNCEWSERPTRKMLGAIKREYVPWRNEIVEAWSRRVEKKVLLVDL